MSFWVDVIVYDFDIRIVSFNFFKNIDVYFTITSSPVEVMNSIGGR